MGRKYICGYMSHLEQLAAYSDEQVGRLYRAMLTYARDGVEPGFKPASPESYIWPSLRGEIDRDVGSYMKSCALKKEARKRGWDEAKQPSPSERQPGEEFEQYRQRLISGMTGE